MEGVEKSTALGCWNRLMLFPRTESTRFGSKYVCFLERTNYSSKNADPRENFTPQQRLHWSTKLTLQKIAVAGLLQYTILAVYYNDIAIPLIPFVNDEIWLQKHVYVLTQKCGDAPDTQQVGTIWARSTRRSCLASQQDQSILKILKGVLVNLTCNWQENEVLSVA